MFKRLLLALMMLLLIASPALAQEGVLITPKHSDPHWTAAYWNNMSFAGAPVLQQSEAAVNYDWQSGSPHHAVSADQFSARWSRYIQVTPGNYRFTATADDGMRVWLDGELIINMWYDHAVLTATADRYLSEGHHLLLVEYYENGGVAVAQFSWMPVEPTIQHWRGEYYNNVSLSGTPALVRDDVIINFDWASGSPAPGVVNSDLFSVRWTRSITIPAGALYRFTATADDGVRVWVNNHLLIDAWEDSARRDHHGVIYLPAGQIPVKMEYYENMGVAVASLIWSPVGATTPGPREVIVDDSSAGFVKGGAATSWRVAMGGYAGSLHWTRNNDQWRANYNWARWYPDLVPGRYEVYVFIPPTTISAGVYWLPAGYSLTAKARYWISHQDGFTSRIVDQGANAGTWVSLGTYRFRGTREDYASLNDITYEPYLSRVLAFDAVRFVPR